MATRTWVRQGIAVAFPTSACMPTSTPGPSSWRSTRSTSFTLREALCRSCSSPAGNINSWAVAAPNYFDWDTPKLQAAASVEQAPQPATYGLTPGQWGTSVLGGCIPARA